MSLHQVRVQLLHQRQVQERLVRELQHALAEPEAICEMIDG